MHCSVEDGYGASEERRGTTLGASASAAADADPTLTSSAAGLSVLYFINFLYFSKDLDNCQLRTSFCCPIPCNLSDLCWYTNLK